VNHSIRGGSAKSGRRCHVAIRSVNQSAAEGRDVSLGGTELVWIIDPHTQTAIVYRRDGTTEILTADGMLDGGSLVPRFRCALRAVLE
jgi:Uma2 family endonuclease